ncbi:hypothetical protein BTN33_08695 [Aeromonas veronii]|nr:hypothetical protein BTN33_08695 [Aeromonas veronii]
MKYKGGFIGIIYKVILKKIQVDNLECLLSTPIHREHVVFQIQPSLGGLYLEGLNTLPSFANN